jgi:hypothetical protein
VFLAGLRHLIRLGDPAYDWIATLVYSTGLIYVTVTLVGASLETGVVFRTPDGTVDRTVDGPLAHGAVLIHGSIARVLTALFLAAAGYAVLRTKVLPTGIGRAAVSLSIRQTFRLEFGSLVAWSWDRGRCRRGRWL